MHASSTEIRIWILVQVQETLINVILITFINSNIIIVLLPFWLLLLSFCIYNAKNAQKIFFNFPEIDVA